MNIENSILGFMLSNERIAENGVQSLKTKFFTDTKLKAIFTEIQNQINGNKLDVFKIADNAKVDFEVLIQMQSDTETNKGNFESHVYLIKERYIFSKLKVLSSKLAGFKWDDRDSFTPHFFKTEIETIENDIQLVKERDKIEILKEIIKDSAEAKGKGFSGVRTGFRILDNLFGGHEEGKLIIDAGRPAMGKSAYMQSEAVSIQRQGIPTGIISIEMSHKELLRRSVSAEIKKPTLDIRKGNVNIKEITKNADVILGGFPFVIDGIGTHYEVLDAIRILSKKGAKVIYIDYLQLIGGRGENRNHVLSMITRSLKLASKKYKITIILLSQLSREVEKRSSKKPMLSDLRDSGAIEQDADIVRFFWRPSYYDIEDYNGEEVSKEDAYIIYAKNRDGYIGEVKMRFINEFTQWCEWEQNQQYENLPF